MGCRYCLNVAIDTWKVHNGMQVLPECCYRYMESLQWCRYCLNVVIDTWKVYNGMQVQCWCRYWDAGECCYRYMESVQWDATLWMDTYTESLQWDAGTAWMLLYIHEKFTMGCRYCLNVALHTWKVYNGMQVLPECCYRYMESFQWDAGTGWMLL